MHLPAPNLAHLLLGFDIQKSLRNQSFLNAGTKINYIGVGGNIINNNSNNISQSDEILSIVPRNCLHSIVRIINKFLLKDLSLINRIPITIDYCYEVLFILCSNIQYNQQLLAYLRSEFDFINNNLRKIPLSGVYSAAGSSHYSIYTWILNLACIELQSLMANRMKVQLKKLVQILTENSSVSSLGSARGATSQQQLPTNSNRILANNSNFDNLLYLNSTANNPTGFNTTTKNANNGDLDTFSINSFDVKADSQSMSSADADLLVENKLFEIVRFMDFVQVAPDALNLNYFDGQLIEKVIESCKSTPEFLPLTSLQLYDLKKLRSILVYEIRDSAASVVSISRSHLLAEIKCILRNVYERNLFHLSFYVKKRYFEAIRLLVESLVTLAPCEVFALNQRFNFLIALTKRLFQMVSNNFKSQRLQAYVNAY